MAAGLLGVKELRVLLQQMIFFVALLFSSTPLSCNAWFLPVYSQPQLDALQGLWDNWKTNTPNLTVNLAGWGNQLDGNGETDFVHYGPCLSWRGVQCLRNINCSYQFQEDQPTVPNSDCSTLIIGLTLNNASIVGTLPPLIGNITSLTTLELTGNPGLTGTIPSTLGNTNPFVFDLHGNAFYGEIPDLGNMDWVTTMDMSGNNFNGTFPIGPLSGMVNLQTFNIGRNNFSGQLNATTFESDPINGPLLTLLVHLDISNNNFSGIFPSPNTIQNLEILIVSNNSFTGPVPQLENSTKNSTLQIVDLSGNKFNGPFPLPQNYPMENLETLNLGRNDFEGVIPAQAFENMMQLTQLDLSSNRFNGSVPNLSMLQNLQTLDLSSNNFTGALPNLTSSFLSTLNLSRNAFNGSALHSWSTSELGSLHEVYLDFNLITGTLNISELFAQGLLSSTISPNSLRVLSLTNNSISHVVYDVNIEGIFTTISLLGNPYCDVLDSNDGTRCFCQQRCINSAAMVSNDKTKVVVIAVVTSVTSLLILVITIAAIYYRNRRYQQYLTLQLQQKFEEFEVQPTIFPFHQLRVATRDFHLDMKLGQGAFGAVYKGILPNGNVVAVKQLFAKTSQSIDEFLNEVVLLTGMKHRNLVSLKGCCIREQQRLLVYEYVDNHDLDKILFAKGPNIALVSWPIRSKICLGVARGLHYLHALAHPRIIHRDIKASNILLAKNNESKIADFGLALLFPDEESIIMTKHVAGTKGYLAPEYASYGQLSDKIDVFSFGVLCLEVVSGRRNIDETLPIDKVYLLSWAWKLHQQGNLMDLVDPTITLQDDDKTEVQRFITIALLCTRNAPEERPSMQHVVAMMQGGSELEMTVLNQGINHDQGQYLDTMRLFAYGDSASLTTVEEEVELSY